jgi:Metallo-peptidase family M12/Secretion system C-terminal sorting domain
MMKYIIALVFSCIWFSMLGQSETLRPAQLVAQTKKEFVPTKTTLFTVGDKRNMSLPAALKEYTILHLDDRALTQFNQEKSPMIELSIPQQGRNNLTLELVEVFPFAPDFTVREAPSMKEVKVNKGKHYRGIIKGQEKSIVAISVFDDEVSGMISHPAAAGNLVIGKLADSDDHILYQDHQIASQNPFECGTEDGQLQYTKEELRGVQTGSRALSDCVRLYFEVDYDIYQNKGSSTAEVTTFVTGIFNQVSTLYTGEQINTVVSEIVIWTQASPYNATTSTGMLNAFTGYRQGFNGDLAQLLSYKASGGVAYVNGLCSGNPDYSMSYSGISSTYQNVPTYSWTVEVVSHEFGHLFGSQHTHACVWNGNNTAIDGCYTPEGSCPNPGLPAAGVGGTIMSYCHLTSAGINFSNGFGPQPGNVIRNRVTNASCLTACSGGGGGGGNACTENVLDLQIRTDNYPGETTWEIRNSSNIVLYSGGPYSAPNSLHNIQLCLPAGCYTFKINDSYGDGICCLYGNGYYNIKQGTNTLISGGQFGATETKSFCATGSTPSCTDGVQNGQETGIDCGGPNCPACPTCTDGIQNGLETGVDCGGPTCPACPTCTDGIQNGQETGVDCGGPSCPVCPGGGNGSVVVTDLGGYYFETGWDGWTDGGIDCDRVSTTYSPEGLYSIRLRDNEGEFSSATSPVYNMANYDSITVTFKFRATSFEANEDFWISYFNGTTWSTVKSYVWNVDFVNNTLYTHKIKIAGPLSNVGRIRFQSDAGDNTDQVYIDAVIVKAYQTISTSSCTDGIQNGQETGIDCGGPNCPACPSGPSCSDGIQNGQETGIDCGGPNCPACPTCSDGIQNGQETGIDCGGPACAACPTCNDGVQNGQETGVDCGGPNCPACPGGGSVTLSGHYFETGWDGWVDGGSDCARYQGTLSPEGQYSIRIRDNSAEQSAMTSPLYNLSAYTTASINFQFRAEGMETGEDFWIQYYNGSTWSTVAALVAGTNFVNNQLYNVTINITGALSNVARFRFQCDATENDDMVYIDAVVISAGTGSNLIATPLVIDMIPNQWVVSETNEDIKIFPNPSVDYISVSAQQDITSIKVYNTTGHLMTQACHSFDQIDVSAWQSGLYILHIETDDQVYTKKLVKK